MTPIYRQHLFCHALIALISTFAVFKKALAGTLHCYFVRRRAIGEIVAIVVDALACAQVDAGLEDVCGVHADAQPRVASGRGGASR